MPSLQGQRVLKKAAESWNSSVGPRRRGKIGRMEGWTDGFFGATAEKGKGSSEQKSLRRNGKITFFLKKIFRFRMPLDSQPEDTKHFFST